MAAFLATQLDFIFFFYGLAFLLLGLICFSIGRERPSEEAWRMLGGFALVHGVVEWLDLGALTLGDSPAFTVARTLLMTASFVPLLEFARLRAASGGARVPGRWIYVPLLTLILIGGVMAGVGAANALARYSLALPGALGAGWALGRSAGARGAAGRSAARSGAIALALYGLAAGAIVPGAAFWPANTLNHAAFISVTGLPIQMVRGLLACWIAFSVWAIAGRMAMLELSSPTYSAYRRRQFALTLSAMAAILVLGWTLTQFLGGIYQRDVEREAQARGDLLISVLGGETATVDAMARALAGAPEVVAGLTGRPGAAPLAQASLDLDVAASKARQGYLLDAAGAVITASANAAHPHARINRDAPAVPTALAGAADRYFTYDRIGRSWGYLTSYPVRSPTGAVVGAVALETSVGDFDARLREMGQRCFFVDPDGVVLLSSQPGMLRRTLWPLPAQTKAALSERYGRLDDRPLLKREVAKSEWMEVGGARVHVARRYAAHSDWSLVSMTPTAGMAASRVLGIIITLLVTIIVLVYLFGRERSVRDHVLMDRRLQLQDMARDLRWKATTDSLTGLHNRHRFDEALVAEIARAERYGTPLALILYDIDHFKQVNDTFGHPAGDSVLKGVSKLAAGHIRATDLLARWGGEEFIILAASSDLAMAAEIAEKLRASIARMAFDAVSPITCSFGVAEYVAGDSAETLVARADAALYRAKAHGRNRVELATRAAGSQTASAA